MFIPKKVCERATQKLITYCNTQEYSGNASMLDNYMELLLRGFRFYVVEQSRGQCYVGKDTNVITIPNWLFTSNHPIEEIEWYISHEMAHAFDLCKHEHGPEFMQWLIKICPPKAIGYETTYKPRNAVAAGIGCYDF